MIKHKGRGSYDVLSGDVVIASGLSKAEAEAKAAELAGNVPGAAVTPPPEPAPRRAWLELAAVIEKVEREEAAHGLRIVTVAANAQRLPVAGDDGRVIHQGRFGGWQVREAIFDDASLEAVIGMSDGSTLGLTVDGSVVEVVHG